MPSSVMRRSLQASDYLTTTRHWLECGFPSIDFQMHTTWTDGLSSVLDMMRAAERQGLSAIAITEHVNHTTTYYPEFREEVVNCRKEFAGIDIFYGVEVAISDYGGGLRTNLQRPRDTELVLGVVHSYPKADGGFHRFADLTPVEALSCELDGLMALAANPLIDVIGHPGGTYFKRFGPFPVALMEPAFQRAADNGIAVEINTAYCWDIVGLFELLEAVNPRLSFGSDAHVANDVGENCKRLRHYYDNFRRKETV